MTEKYCICCDKEGHYTNECWSTHGLNTPYDREIDRLCQLASFVEGHTKPTGVVTVTGWPSLTSNNLENNVYTPLYSLPPGRWNVYALRLADGNPEPKQPNGRLIK